MLAKDKSLYSFESNNRKPEWGSSSSQLAINKRDITGGSFNSNVNTQYDDLFKNKFCSNKNSAGFGNRGFSNSQPDTRMANTRSVEGDGSGQTKNFKTASEELVSINRKLLSAISVYV